MTDAEVYEVLQEAFNSVFQRRDITVTSRLAAPDVIGWDSIKQLDLIIEVEERLGFEIDGGKLTALRNIGDLAALVKREVAARS